MRTSPGAALDRRIETVILTFARRDRPLLRLVPTALLRPVVAPTALRLRRSIVRGTLVIGIPAAAVLALWLGPGVASSLLALLYGDPSTPDDSARSGVVMTSTGALAWVGDFQGGSTQLQVWDRRSTRTSDFRTLDSVPQPREISRLRVSGSTISWPHGGKRRTARIV